jgi:hypothetical protein
VALLLALMALGIPTPPKTPAPAAWDVLFVVVGSVDVPVPSLRGTRRIRVSLDQTDRKRIREETAAFARRVREGTAGRLEIRSRTIAIEGLLTSVSGPGPFWISPADLAPHLDVTKEIGRADSVIVFVKIGEDRGPAIPTRHFGGAVGGDLGPGGACFAAVTFRPRWLDGKGTVVLHEWLHHLDWALTEVGGFPDASFPDPDDARHGRPCCPDAPGKDGPFADHVLGTHLTPAMMKAADARRGPAIDDGWLRGWRVDGLSAPGNWRTLTLAPDQAAAAAALPAGTDRLLIHAISPIVVTGGGKPVRVRGERTIAITGSEVTVRHATKGTASRFRIRAIDAP